MPLYLNELYKIARDENIPLIEVYKEVTHDYFTMSSTSWTGMYVDWAHPSVSGHTYIANILLRPLYNNILFP